jgi:hypothetical protein
MTRGCGRLLRNMQIPDKCATGGMNKRRTLVRFEDKGVARGTDSGRTRVDCILSPRLGRFIWLRPVKAALPKAYVIGFSMNSFISRSDMPGMTTPHGEEHRQHCTLCVHPCGIGLPGEKIKHMIQCITPLITVPVLGK